MLQQLSGVSIILFIAGGVQTILFLFIFAKRQIMRFTIRSRRGPHIPIACDTNKSLRKEIDRRIRVLPNIQYEPDIEDFSKKMKNSYRFPCHYHRLKAISDMKTMELHLIQRDGTLTRHPKENIRGFLINALSSYVRQNGPHVVHQVCDLYERARHDPGEFKNEDYCLYSKLLLKMTRV